MNPTEYAAQEAQSERADTEFGEGWEYNTLEGDDRLFIPATEVTEISPEDREFAQTALDLETWEGMGA